MWRYSEVVICRSKDEVMEAIISGRCFIISLGADVGAWPDSLSDSLKSNSTLTYLDLRGNSIDDRGARALSDFLKSNSTLTTLNLNENSIGELGASLLSDSQIKLNSHRTLS